MTEKDSIVSQQLLKIQQNIDDDIVKFKEKQTKVITKQEQINADAIKAFNTLYLNYQTTFNEINSNNTAKLNEYCVKQNSLYENQIVLYESQKAVLFEKLTEQTKMMFELQKKATQSKIAEINHYCETQKKSADSILIKVSDYCQEQQESFANNIKRLTTKQQTVENSFVNLSREVETRKQMLVDTYTLNITEIHKKYGNAYKIFEDQLYKLEARYVKLKEILQSLSELRE